MIGRASAWMACVWPVLAMAACGSDFEPAGIVGPEAGQTGHPSAGAAGASAGTGAAQIANGAGGSSASGGASLTGDLPCEVFEPLRARCHECHGFPIRGGAPVRLLTRADLLAQSQREPNVRVIDRILVRVQDDAMPMPLPPRMRATAAEVAALQAWVDAGTPAGTCGDGSDGGSEPAVTDPPAAPDPAFSAGEVCTSNDYWNDGDDGSRRMHPGRACVSCHAQHDGDAPSFAIGGTVFPTAHEPDECYGVDGEENEDMFVVITDAGGRELRLEVNDAGNFHSDEDGDDDIAFPIRAKVVRAGRERVMAGERMTGDCNSCHTQDGASGAPGRIVAPL